MKVMALVKSLPQILRGDAVVITIKEKRVVADCGKLGKKTVRQIATKLLENAQ
jgi:hypothetical protein